MLAFPPELSRPIARSLLAALGAGLLSLGFASAADAAETTLQPAQCDALAGMTIPAERIGLPTTGARIVRAAMVPADDAKGKAHPAYCLAVGEIAPVDHTAPPITFNVGLPASWNGKAFMLGGGGFDGFIPEVTGNLPTADAAPSPLARGYAVFSSDSGHTARTPGLTLDGSFVDNREALMNWEGEALKKTHDVALAVVERAYGRRPAVAYFGGGSGGGREALQAAARWPADWNAIIALYPARNGAAVALGALRNSQALAAPGGWIPPAKRALVYQAALERCDGLDGAKDGVISDVRGCRAVFDPAKASLNGAPLRCADGADSAPTCLSDAQLNTLRRIDAPARLPFALASGDTTLPGFNAYTADTGRPVTSQAQGAVTFFGFGMAPPSTPPVQGSPFLFNIADQFVRHFVTGDLASDPLAFDIDHPGPYAARLRELSQLDAADIDMAGFARRGGKMLILQGTDDFEVSPRATEAYYGQLRKALGDAAADRTIRFYEVPGFAHTISAIFMPEWDPVGTLERWSEQGVDPADTLTITDAIGVPGRIRPLCQYPAWPRYKAGDVNAAASFVCAR